MCTVQEARLYQSVLSTSLADNSRKFSILLSRQAPTENIAGTRYCWWL